MGFVAGWTGSGLGLARTSDGGASWQRIAIPASHISVLRFIDANVGWAGALVLRDVPQVACSQAAPAGASPCYGVVLRTQDAGRTWQETLTIPTDTINGEPIRQLEAVDGQRAWALVQAPCTTTPPAGYLFNCPAELRRTADGGRTWTILLRDNIASIRFASVTRGWLAMVDASGTAEVRVTSDGGSTWTTTLRTASGAPMGLDAATNQTAWLMTEDTSSCSASQCGTYTLFRTDDGGTTWASIGNPNGAIGGCTLGHLAGPLFASPSTGWLALNLGAGGVAGPGGLLQTKDGGKTWRCAAKPPNTYLISAADPLHLWVNSVERGSEVSTLYSSDDGGATWRTLDLSPLG